MPNSMASANLINVSNTALKIAIARLVRSRVGETTVANEYTCLRAGVIRRALEAEYACSLKSKKDVILRAIVDTLQRGPFTFRGNKHPCKRREAASKMEDAMSILHDDPEELVYAFGKSPNPQTSAASCATASNSTGILSDAHQFGCDHCEYRCANDSVLSRHQRFHSAARIFACDNCGFRFSRRDDLASHIRTHTRAVPILSAISSKDIETAVTRLVRAAVDAREEFSAQSIRHTLESEFSRDLSARNTLIMSAIQAALVEH
jgi:hypothetical protein